LKLGGIKSRLISFKSTALDLPKLLLRLEIKKAIRSILNYCKRLLRRLDHKLLEVITVGTGIIVTVFSNFYLMKLHYCFPMGVLNWKKSDNLKG
jgi:hypothetical protein